MLKQMAVHRGFWILLGLWLWVLPVLQAGPQTEFIDSDTTDLPLGLSGEYRLLEAGEPTGFKHIQLSRFTPLNQAYVNFGTDDRFLWLRAKVKNRTDRAQDQILRLGYIMLECDGYQLSETGQISALEPWRTGSWQRLYRLHFRALEEKDLRLRCNSSLFLGGPFELMDITSFWQKEMRFQLVGVLYYAGLGLLLAYALVVYFISSRKVYFYYVFFLGSFGLLQTVLDGTLMEYLDNLAPIKILSFTSVGLSGVGMMFFLQELLGTKRSVPKLHIFAELVKYYSLLIVLASFILPIAILRVATPVIGFLMPMAMVLSGIGVWKQKREVASLFLLGSFFYLLGMISYTLCYWGYDVFGLGLIQLTYLLKLTSAADLLCLGLALTFRVREMATQQKETQSKLKQLSERYSRLMSNSPMGFLFLKVIPKEAELNAALVALDANRRFYQFFSTTPAEVLGKPLAQLGSVDCFENDVLQQLFDIASKGGQFKTEVQLAQSPQCFSLNAFQANPGLLALVFEDISDLKKISLELAKSKEVAEAASLAKSHFMRNISHEFRTPLNGVVGMSFLLGETDLDGDQRSYLTDIQASSTRLGQLVEDILDFEQVQTKALVAPNNDLPETNLKVLIQQVVDGFQAYAVKKGLALNLSLDPALDCRSSIDGVKVKKVVYALLSNAIKFTNQGEVQVTVGVGLNEPREVVVSVEDTGVGIDEKDRDLIFQGFTQADGSSTRPQEGAGLGLAICKGMSEQLQGRLWFESIPGQGTCFYFVFPLSAIGNLGGSKAGL